jgi:hypothetical protein
MDPLTTLIIFPAVIGTLATARPQYERLHESFVDVRREIRVSTKTGYGNPTRAATEGQLFAADRFGLDRRDLLIDEIALLSERKDGWDGEGSHGPTAAARNAAEQFLQTLSAGIPLPVPMMTMRGEIEFYWDLPTGYADMSFDADGIGSFFAKTINGEETFIDDMRAGDIYTEAYASMLSCLAPQAAVSAA